MPHFIFETEEQESFNKIVHHRAINKFPAKCVVPGSEFLEVYSPEVNLYMYARSLTCAKEK